MSEFWDIHIGWFALGLFVTLGLIIIDIERRDYREREPVVIKSVDGSKFNDGQRVQVLGNGHNAPEGQFVCKGTITSHFEHKDWDVTPFSYTVAGDNGKEYRIFEQNLKKTEDSNHA